MTAKPFKVGVVLREGFDLRAFANISETLAAANKWLQGGRYLCLPIGTDWQRVRSRSQVDLRVKGVVDESVDYDLIVLLDNCPLDGKEGARLAGWLRRASRFGAALGGVGMGNWTLAAAGLAEGAELALPFEAQAAFKETFGTAATSTSAIAIGEGLVSADSASQAGAMMLQWLRLRHGDPVAARAANDLGIDYWELSANEQQRGIAQRLQVTHPGLEAAIALMEENLEEPLSQKEVARRAGLSRRQLERLFLHKLGASPQVFYRNLRLRHARQLLLQTSLSVTEVGLATGFVSISHFSRVFRAEFGMSPLQLRKRSDRERDFSLAVTLS